MRDPRNPDRFDGTPILGLTKYDRIAKDPHRFDGVPIIGVNSREQKDVEVCRSFAFKASLQHYGGNQFESADFFASRKTTAGEEDVPWVSQQIFEECVTDVKESMQGFISAMRAKKAQAQLPATAPGGNVKNYEAWKARQNGDAAI